MTIRRRLTVSFLAILILFGLNLVIYFWSSQKRSASVEDLRLAISRQILVASIKQQLNDIQKQIALLSQITAEVGTGGGDPEQVAQFKAQIDSIAEEIKELRDIATADGKPKIETFEKDFKALGESWTVFYENFGSNTVKAITELAIRGDPLGQRVIQQLVPQLQEDEKARVERSSASFYAIARLTNQMTILIYVISTLVAVIVAYRVSSYLARGLGELKGGTALIGAGNLDYRIILKANDELGDLAQAFNEMSVKLQSARTELESANRELEVRNKEVEKQKQVSESLLLNILPSQVAEELQKNGSVDPKYFEDVTILFADIVGFTLATEKLAAEELVYLLNDYFTAFDHIVKRYNLEKLKTIGDSYMCVGGLPVRYPSHPVDVVMAAFEMIQAVKERNRPDSLTPWSIRIGIHTGSVIAGVVGIQKFAFDIWSEAVNHASRHESSGVPSRINISERTYSRVKDFFECEHRGKVLTKDKKEVDMYFVNGILPTLLDDSKQIPPTAFLRRYKVYFEKSPPDFPPFLIKSNLADTNSSQKIRTDPAAKVANRAAGSV